MNTPQLIRPASIGDVQHIARRRRTHITRAIATGALPVLAENINAKGRTPRVLMDPDAVMKWVIAGCPLIKSGV